MIIVIRHNLGHSIMYMFDKVCKLISSILISISFIVPINYFPSN